MTDAQAKRTASTRLNRPEPGDTFAPPSKVVRTHEEKVERRLLAIAWFSGFLAVVVAIGIVVSLISGLVAAVNPPASPF